MISIAFLREKINILYYFVKIRIKIELGLLLVLRLCIIYTRTSSHRAWQRSYSCDGKYRTACANQPSRT